MPDQDNIFNSESGQSDPQSSNQPSNSNLFADQLAGIKNPDGSQKYDSVEKALEGSKHAQEYIAQLKSELSSKDAEYQSLKAELEKRGSVEDVVSKLLPQKESEDPGTPPQAQGLTEEEVVNLVQRANQQIRDNDTKSNNEKLVNDSLINKYGDKATEVLSNKAKELNMSIQDVQNLSQNNPQLVLALFEQKQTYSATPSTSSVNIHGSSTGTSELAPPEKSLLLGATDAEKNAYFRKCVESVHAELGVQQ